MITTRDLTKRFGNVEAVREVSLDVREGDRYGLLGPNGSGKSTLVRMLLGLVYATSGEISVLGHRIPNQASRALPEIGALIEEPAAYPHLSGRANLRLLDAAGPHGARRTRRRRVDDALEQVGLAGIDRRPVRAYSLGMRQRLGLAAALVRRPRLLILDEPTNGLDPRGIRDIRDLLVGLNDEGVTVFLSSHLLPEVSALCTRIGVLDSGMLVLQDQLASLQQPTGRVLISTDDPERAVATLDGLVEHRDGADLVVRSPDPAELNARLVGAGVPVRSLVVQRRSLEEIVLDLTGTGSDQFGVPASEPGGTAKAEPPPSAGGAPADPADAVPPVPADAVPPPPKIRKYRDRGRVVQACPAGANLVLDRADLRAAAGRRHLHRGHAPRPAAGAGQRVPFCRARRRAALPGSGAGPRAAGVPAGRRGGGGGRLDRGRGFRGHAALPAGPPGGTDPAAGRQAHLGHHVHADGRRRCHGHLIRDRRADPRTVARGGRRHPPAGSPVRSRRAPTACPRPGCRPARPSRRCPARR